jgi:hypothetical protein
MIILNLYILSVYFLPQRQFPIFLFLLEKPSVFFKQTEQALSFKEQESQIIDKLLLISPVHRTHFFLV